MITAATARSLTDAMIEQQTRTDYIISNSVNFISSEITNAAKDGKSDIKINLFELIMEFNPDPDSKMLVMDQKYIIKTIRATLKNNEYTINNIINDENPTDYVIVIKW